MERDRTSSKMSRSFTILFGTVALSTLCVLGALVASPIHIHVVLGNLTQSPVSTAGSVRSPSLPVGPLELVTGVQKDDLPPQATPQNRSSTQSGTGLPQLHMHHGTASRDGLSSTSSTPGTSSNRTAMRREYRKKTWAWPKGQAIWGQHSRKWPKQHDKWVHPKYHPREEAEGLVAAAGNKSKAACDLCSTNWLFIVSTGRSGSTTLMNMLNEIPFFEIDGENNGLAGHLFELHKAVAVSQREIISNGDGNPKRHAWFKSNPSDEIGMRCAMQAYALAFLGKTAGALPKIGIPVENSSSVIGWKEIRYGSAAELGFMRQVFPCAKFVISTRLDLKAQQRSAFHKYTRTQLQDLRRKTEILTNWAKNQPRTIALTVALEHFSTTTFNHILKFLGVAGCQYRRLLHSNVKAYKPDASRSPVINCVEHALKW